MITIISIVLEVRYKLVAIRRTITQITVKKWLIILSYRSLKTVQKCEQNLMNESVNKMGKCLIF